MCAKEGATNAGMHVLHRIAASTLKLELTNNAQFNVLGNVLGLLLRGYQNYSLCGNKTRSNSGTGLLEFESPIPIISTEPILAP